ncbi:MAG: GNAT family N-acetyltransferase [Gammaproteobacteria bacterium]|nr:GNAT family N-acetyltransferase [Gammaproteobacteria bacterium]
MIEKPVLDKKEFLKLTKLADVCYKYDGFSARMYWNIIKERAMPGKHDYFYLVNKQIVAYLASFIFKKGEAEITAMVHPNYRRQGIFKKLLKKARSDLKNENLDKIIFICPHQATVIISYLEKLGAKLDHSELVMKLQTVPDSMMEIPNLNLESAERSELMKLVDLHVKCFPDPVDRTARRFVDGFIQPNRKIYKLILHGDMVGKVHVRWDQDRPFLHDLCITPSEQNKNYGQWMVQKIIKILKDQGYHKIYLEVLADNEPAKRLYEKTGFIVTDHFDYLFKGVKS